MIGDVIGHYTILRKIGMGGMGEVFLARDEKLDRSAVGSTVTGIAIGVAIPIAIMVA